MCEVRLGEKLVLAPVRASLLGSSAVLRSVFCRFAFEPLSLMILVAGLVALNKSSVVNAGELNAAHVPADAMWLIHVDYAALSGSPMWQKIREEKPVVAKMMQGLMMQRYGIDLSTDLKSITMFSRDYKI